MNRIRNTLVAVILITVVINTVEIAGGSEKNNLPGEILAAALVPPWLLYMLIPVAMLVSSLLTVMFVRRGDSELAPENVNEALLEPGIQAGTAADMIVPEPEETPKVAVEQPGRGPIPINVHEVPTTTPPNPGTDIEVPTISTFEVAENPTDLFFHDGTLWVASQDEDGIANYTNDGDLISSMPLHPYPTSLSHDGDELWVGTYFAVRTFDLKGGMGSAPVELRRPTDMLYAGDSMWIANSGRDVVTRVSKDRQTIMNIESGTNPQKLSFDGEHIWVVNNGDSSISKISLEGEVVGVWETGTGPKGITYGNSHIWVTNALGNTVSRFSLTGDKVGEYPTGTLPGDVVHDGAAIWVANRTDKTVTKYGDDGTHLGTFHLGKTPDTLVTDGSGTVWAAHSAEGMVSKLVMENIQVATFPVGNAPEPIIYDGNHLWVGNALSHTIMKINLEGGQE
nr:hypothetical protein [Dehalococcoidia bacterium]